MACACKSGIVQRPTVRQIVKPLPRKDTSSTVVQETSTKKPTIRRIIRRRH